MARITISLPDKLKSRMEEVTESVNWSAVAAAAFENKLGELAKLKETKTMNEIVARLKASKNATDDVEYKEGYNLGVDWASHRAEYSELAHLVEFKEKWGEEDSTDEVHGLMQWIAKSVNSELDYLDFWSSVFNESYSVGSEIQNTTIPKLDGFIDGAVEIFTKVQDQLVNE